MVKTKESIAIADQVYGVTSTIVNNERNTANGVLDRFLHPLSY